MHPNVDDLPLAGKHYDKPVAKYMDVARMIITVDSLHRTNECYAYFKLKHGEGGNGTTTSLVPIYVYWDPDGAVTAHCVSICAYTMQQRLKVCPAEVVTMQYQLTKHVLQRQQCKYKVSVLLRTLHSWYLIDTAGCVALSQHCWHSKSPA